MEDDIAQILIPGDEIQAKVRELGIAISHDYADRRPLLVGVLKGIVYFLSDVLRAITIPVSIDLIAISRFSPEREHTGVVRFLKDLDEDIQGRHVIVVEDLVDTGLTLGYILKNLRVRQPASISVCTLFERPQHRIIPVPIRYSGFRLPDCFVVGYGLDYRERYRQLPYVGVLRAEILGITQHCDERI